MSDFDSDVLRTLFPTSSDTVLVDLLRREIWIDGDITDHTLRDIVRGMMQMSKHSPHPIEVYVNSNGGDVSSGLGIADYFRYLTNKSFVIPTKVMGVAYSAGALISSAGTPGHRSAMPSSRFLIHQLRAAGVEGNMEDLESDIKNLEKLNDQITTLLVKATKQKKKRVVADLRQETYMSAEEALNYGLIDHIL